ncbi:hypothetical protein PENNAL_c0036G03411 [Penicillium nalgiovense]|uniref:Uncharacterized protein n=1 Tax=Penicillium nalgiovense TaxID=60175 RepID=A0A1V6Y509_PENNA|nr:hypothetical protein PENNAL_c0036G03411 [Penicillium nalgiovense]
MKFQIWALGLAALSSGVSAGCAYSWDHTSCEWFGNSPACGEVDNKIGDKDKDGWVLVDWTKDVGISDKWGMGYCKSSYGNTCWSGYKRLWCKSMVDKERMGLNPFPIYSSMVVFEEESLMVKFAKGWR